MYWPLNTTKQKGQAKTVCIILTARNIPYFTTLQDGKTEGELMPVQDLLKKLTKTRYTFHELLEVPLPEGVDPLKLESYLSDIEFEVNDACIFQTYFSPISSLFVIYQENKYTLNVLSKFECNVVANTGKITNTFWQKSWHCLLVITLVNNWPLALIIDLN